MNKYSNLCLILLAAWSTHVAAAEPIIAPVSEELWSLSQKAVFSALDSDDEDDKSPINMLATIAHDPTLLYVFLPLATKLGSVTKISPRDLEILALRTSFRAQSEYEWEHHYSSGLKAGISEQDMNALLDEDPRGELSESDLLLIRTADELVMGTKVSPETMIDLMNNYSTAEVVEIIFIVNQYNGLSKFAKSLGIQLESGYKKGRFQEYKSHHR
ncbi:carboxymuconolactone decarboxylase family protein [Halieaceae bacterium IMCC14734]|uniref:Carboxymuconolactone decarboxylase family protein n=1 Tax=Candidatus Litorirhabdus singularis TaxID=2518993 RepID=A0ABT3THM0_9GAMM|nr:carboxymuconolactone decarboxylase family protein [Candidatus Litorirhabdus singularis]MCX2981822.1 carboxymuconolactone decarboxylase family protein [Candidatus Litorirhabdus singularis]